MRFFFILIFLSLTFFYSYASQKTRDPFVSLEKLLLKSTSNKSVNVSKRRSGEIEKLLNALKLEGIIYSSQNPRVIISEKILKEGDKIREFTIKKILPHKVILQYGKKEVELKIEIPSFKNALKSEKIKKEGQKEINFKINLPFERF